MSAPAIPLAGPAAAARAESREEGNLLDALAPREGWSAWALVVLMLLLLAWSVDAADYRGGDLGWLSWVMLLGASWSLVAAKLRLPRWQAHALGALIGGGAVIVLAAMAASDDPDLGARLRALGHSAVVWYTDVTGPSHLSLENVAWQVLCGIVSWTTAQHASYAVFGHRRSLVAIAVPGVLLLANMIIAAAVGIAYLVLYTAAALLLLVRLNLVAQREAWAGRGIGEAAGVGDVATRSGLLVVGGAVALALALATVGSSAPLTGLWDVFTGRAGDVALRLNDWFNLSPAVRFHGDAFETSQLITGEWDATEIPTVEIVASDDRPHYLRATTYDGFIDGNRWIQAGLGSTAISAGSSLIADLVGDGDLATSWRTEVTLRVTTLRESRVVLSPAIPTSVSIPVRLDRLDDGPFAALRPIGGTLPAGSTYQVVALVPLSGVEGLTKNQLRHAGNDYPEEIVARYATISRGAFAAQPVGHPSVSELATDLVRAGAHTNSFDIADAFQWYLSNPQNFNYSSNVRGKCGQDEAAVDCFLRIREGYCEYYASTMIMMLRSQGIPARLAAGYLPPGKDGVVLSSSAHAWVEVYFPGYGWAPFDPTGGNGAAPIAYAEGPVVGTPDPSGAANQPGGRVGGPLEDEGGLSGPGGGSIGAADSLLPISLLAVVALAGLGLVGLVALAGWRRRRRSPDPLAAYGSLTRIAALFGFPPQAWQTVYEYTGVLADVVPEARPELEAVARAKVEATYRPGPLGGDRLERAAEAYGRLRVGLARLILRRGRRRAVEAEHRRRRRGPRLPGGSPWSA